MDRFKFRVWKQDNWGYNIKNEFVKQKPHYEYFELNNNNIVFHKNDITEQCTGLKDKNGKLIYEGDIVEFYSYSFINAISGESMKRRVGVVVWNDEMLKFDVTVNGESIPDLCKKTDDNQFVVIGNIHENKDLLGGM